MLKIQKGKVTKFKRLSKKNSQIKKKIKLKNLYNLIRVLDMRDEAYENAFIESAKIMSRIYKDDSEISKLVKKLVKNQF